MAPQEAISVAMLAMLRSGDHVVVAFPGYQSLYQIAQTIGAEITYWHMRTDEEGGLGFQVSSSLNVLQLLSLTSAFGFPNLETEAIIFLRRFPVVCPSSLHPSLAVCVTAAIETVQGCAAAAAQHLGTYSPGPPLLTFYEDLISSCQAPRDMALFW